MTTQKLKLLYGAYTLLTQLNVAVQTLTSKKGLSIRIKTKQWQGQTHFLLWAGGGSAKYLRDIIRDNFKATILPLYY